MKKSGKAAQACKLSDKPKFILALIATILCKPERVKCCLFKIRLRASLKSTPHLRKERIFELLKGIDLKDQHFAKSLGDGIR
jgi:hypothetical protein